MEGGLSGWGQESMGSGDCRLKTPETGKGMGCLRHGIQPGKSRDTDGREVNRDHEKESHIQSRNYDFCLSP